MSQTYQFYADRADAAERAAEEAVLDNVRERELRAAKTWRGLAEQARSVTRQREKIQREKDEARAMEAGESAAD